MLEVADVIVFDVVFLMHNVLGDCVKVSVNFRQHEFGHGRIGNIQWTCAFSVFSTFTMMFDRRVDVFI